MYSYGTVFGAMQETAGFPHAPPILPRRPLRDIPCNAAWDSVSLHANAARGTVNLSPRDSQFKPAGQSI
eukprot:361291-Chlamydomonas_euryale.AAC.3